MKTPVLAVAAALLLSGAAMAAEPGKPLSSDPHGTPMPADQAGDGDSTTMDLGDNPGTDDPEMIEDEGSTVGSKDAAKRSSSDPHPHN